MANVWRRQRSPRLTSSDLVRTRATDANHLIALTFFEPVVGGSVTGTIAVTAGAASAALNGTETALGTVGVAAAPAGAALMGAEVLLGTVGLSASPASVAGSGQQQEGTTGTVAVVASAAAASLSGSEQTIGTVGASASPASAEVAATLAVAGSLNGTAEKAAITGEASASGGQAVPSVVPSYHGGWSLPVSVAKKPKKRKRPLDDPEVVKRLLLVIAERQQTPSDPYAQARAEDDSVVLGIEDWAA